MGIGAAETSRLLSELDLVDKFTPKAKAVTKSLGGLEKGMHSIGRGAGQVGAGLTRAGAILGGAVVTGLGASAKAAIDWEDAFQGVVKTVDEADLKKAGLSFEDIAKGLRTMATEMPNSAVELAGIAENAGALGIAGKDILAFTKQVAILASTTNVSAEDAATGLGQLQNVIGLTGDEFDNFAASLVDLGNKGASTEGQILEIARRAGGAAKLFGIAKDETLGWAAAAANLGLNEELAGTALQNVFVKLLPKISNGSKELQTILGKSAKEIRTSFAKDAGGALEDLVARLGKMPKDARLKAVQSLFGKGSGITRLVLGLADSYATNLAPALDTATQSWKDATAAQIEFDKRNATVKSALLRFKNTALDAAITIGEGFAPALGRAADRLSTFLKSGENRDFLKGIGEDIGKSIDAIDWAAVIKGGKDFVDVLKIAFDYAKRIFDAVNALPPEIKAAGLGFLTLNKLSGGLIGEGLGGIAGGLGKVLATSIGAALPGPLGKAFVQPVFVTNFPAGGLGGGAAGGVAGAAKTGLSAISKVFLVGEAIGLAVAVNEVRNGISEASTAQASAIQDQTTQYIASQPKIDDLKTSLAGVNQGIHDLEFNPLNVLVQGEALDKLRAMRTDLEGAIADREASRTATEDRPGRTDSTISGGDIEKLRSGIAAGLTPVATSIDNLPGKMADDLTLPISTAVDAFPGKLADANAPLAASLATIAPNSTATAVGVAAIPVAIGVAQAAQVVAADSTTASVDAASASAAQNIAGAKDSIVTSTGGTTTAARNAGYVAASASRSAGYGIEAAIRANRPITNVNVSISATTVEQTVSVTDRYGDPSTSRNSNGSGTQGNGGY